MNLIYKLLAHSWSGLIIVVVVVALGWLVVWFSRRSKFNRLRFVGYGFWVVAGLLAIGSVTAIIRINAASRPPMGELVDVGGYRMHILAEGQSRGRPTIVWIPGGHAPGLGFYGHHKQMRSETRSILFDRPGTGWSDTGPFPRRTAKEAEELATLLEQAKEPGPFILVGHSYGGLLAANFARRFPKKTAAVILLDATQPDSLVYNRYAGGDGLGMLVRLHQVQGVLKLFGIHFDPYRKFAEQYPEINRIQKLQDQYLAEVRDTVESFSLHPASDWAAASIFSEFNSDQIARTAPHLMVYDEELADIPVRVVIPKDDPAIAKLIYSNGTESGAARLGEVIRKRYTRISRNSLLMHPPPGTGHNFPYEVPDYVTRVVREVLAEMSVAPSLTPQ